MIIAFCVGWVSAICFVWILLNKFDGSGKFAVMLGGGSKYYVDNSGPSFDLQLQQLSALVKDNTELLHALRELKPVKPRQIVVEPDSQELSFEDSEVSSPMKKQPKKPVSVTEVHKEGFLYLQNVSKGWSKYYIVLTMAQLSVYKNRDAPRLAHIKLGSLSVERANTKYSIIIRSTKDMSILIPESEGEQSLDDLANSILFRSKDEREIEEWESAIQTCISKTNRFLSEGEDDSFDLLEDEDAFSDDFTDEEVLNSREVEAKKEQPEKSTNLDYLSFAKNNREKQMMKVVVKRLGDMFNPKKHDGPTLLRFLKARQMDPHKAADMLKARIEWENKVKPEEITMEMVKSEAMKKKGYFHCYDKTGRPIIVVLASAHTPKDSNVQVMLKLVIYVLEKAIASAPEGIENFSAIFDCTGFAVGQMDWPLVKESIATLQNYYPERLGALYIVNYPFVINMLWKMIKPWLDARTAEKFQFLDVRKLPEFIEPKYLPSRFGGRSLFEKSDFVLGVETLAEGYVPPQKQ